MKKWGEERRPNEPSPHMSFSPNPREIMSGINFPVLGHSHHLNPNPYCVSSELLSTVGLDSLSAEVSSIAASMQLKVLLVLTR